MASGIQCPKSGAAAPGPQPSSAEALLAQIACGDKLAMRTLFVSHQTRVYRFILRIVGDATLAEELVTDVFLDVWRQADRFEARSSAGTWLLAIAHNKAVSALRRRKRNEVDIAAAAGVADHADDPEVALQKKCAAAIVRKYLPALSAKHAEVIDFIYYQGKSIREVAKIINIPETTVKTRVFAARRVLANRLSAAGLAEAVA
jgi:RNA polymerase sigma-70 factor (ECF subfamily)